WLNRSEAVPDGELLISLGGYEVCDRTFTGPTDLTGRLIQTMVVEDDSPAAMTLTQDFHFRLDHDHPVPYEELIGSLTLLQHLVSIGTDRIAVIGDVRFYHPDVVRTFGERRVKRAITYYAVLLDRELRSEDKGPKPREMLFSLADLGGVEVLPKWLG